MTAPNPSSGTPAVRPMPAARTALASPALLLALISAAAFALSGPFAKSLFDVGWTPGAAVAVRIGGAAVVLLVPVTIILVRRWTTVKGSLGRIAIYGVAPIALCQLFYFNAVQHLSVGVALLLEYLSPVLLVVWAWFMTRRRPRLLTIIGGASAMAGLVLVLDLAGDQRVSVAGVLWGLGAAVCSAVYFVMSARTDDDVPPVLMAGGGMAVGAVLILLLGWTGLLPMAFTFNNPVFAGAEVSWLVPVLGLVLVTTVFAYLMGIVATRGLGSKVASFVALFEVLFAVVWAWLLLGEMPRFVQLLGGVAIMAGVVLVRLDELRGSPVRGGTFEVDLNAPAGPGGADAAAAAEGLADAGPR
ncbi:drug/metabolite transporter (DMT)-like permease [Arthrobacter stackebrandtii]|uniref:Drug/metabolite transporter (DMT)-like permease n=1 Tax=Arthrobacter stackebrandtii TaxID=272161 RepID=A0ABS4YV69_9MICC|nr:EamA family transporter [Arthrobacter stackebrandtii]MBP2412639.1 drug/metabolite transporter (DMT)-like permease [Arthrobacter stackebrandtii]